MSLKLTLRGDVWHVTGTVVRHDGRQVRVRQSTGFSLHQKRFAGEMMSRIMLDAVNSETLPGLDTVQDAVNVYLNRSDSPGETDAWVLRRLAKTFGPRKLASLSAVDVHGYVNARGNKAGTVRREINSIGAMLTYARRMGLGAPMLDLVKPSVDDARLRWLTQGERDAFIAACPEEIRRLTAFLFLTGVRLGEAFALRGTDVTEDSVKVSTRKGKMKTRRYRSIPIHPSLDWLEPGGHDFVFQIDGKQWERGRFYRYWEKALAATGIEDFVPHDCRHTFASHLVQGGVSLRAVADLLGHTSLVMVMRYAHLAPTHLRDAVLTLGVIGTKLTHMTPSADEIGAGRKAIRLKPVTGGDGGIRTHDALLAHTPLAGSTKQT